MASKGRWSGDISKLIENFLDDYESDLSPNMFNAIEDLTDDIERIEENYNHEISELKEEKQGLEKELEELQNDN